MKHLLDRLLRRRRPLPFDAPLAPAEPLAVIGDVHGCDGLLADLLDRLDRDHPGHRIVLVGDYLDRGEGSAAVLDRLRARPDLICLMGNHEAMCLRFLDDPATQGPRWLRNGGLQTLAGYGVGGVGLGADPDRLQAARDALARTMGDDRIDWLRSLPCQWRSGNVAVVHAGADPGRPLDDQDDKVLLWGHSKFDTVDREDGLWIVHGHTIVDAPRAAGGRIAVDTGAYATGRLTAALIDAGSVRFIGTGA